MDKKVEQAIRKGLAAYSQQHRKGKKPVEQGHVDKVLSAFKEEFSKNRRTSLSDLELMFLEGSVKDKMPTYYKNRSTVVAKAVKGSPKTITEQESGKMASEVVGYINELLPDIDTFERAIDKEIEVQFQQKGIQKLSESGVEFLKEKEKEILKIYYDARSDSKKAFGVKQNNDIMNRCTSKIEEVVEHIAKNPKLFAIREYPTQAIEQMIDSGDLSIAVGLLKESGIEFGRQMDASKPKKHGSEISFEEAMAQTEEHIRSGNPKAAQKSVREALGAFLDRDDKYKKLEQSSEALAKEAERFRRPAQRPSKGGLISRIFGK